QDDRITSRGRRARRAVRGEGNPRSGDERRVAEVVIGTAEGYDVEALAPFVESLRGCGYRGDTVLLVRAITPRTEAYLRRRGVHLIPYSVPKLRGLRFIRAWANRALDLHHRVAGEPPVVIRDWLIQWVWHLNAARFVRYLRYLQSDGSHYQRIMLTDVRD